MFPTADQIAIALVTACIAVGYGDPELIASKRQMGDRARARHVAFAALIDVFPDARKAGLARCCGYGTPDAAFGNLKNQFRGKSRWWNEDWVDEVVGALVADQYGERAA